MTPPGQPKQTTLNQNIDLNQNSDSTQNNQNSDSTQNNQNSDSTQNNQNSDSTQNNQNSDFNQYSDYLDNLCLYSQLCTITSMNQYVEFFEQHLEKKS